MEYLADNSFQNLDLTHKLDLTPLSLEKVAGTPVCGKATILIDAGQLVSLLF